MGSVEVNAAVLDGVGARIEYRERVDHGFRHRVHDREVDAAVVTRDIELVSSLVENHADRAIGQVDLLHAGPVTGRVDDHEVVRTHAGHVAPGSRGVPDNAARITE